MASTILNIESSTNMCSVSIAVDGAAQVSRSINEGYSHAEKLAVFVDEVIKESGIQLNQLDSIAISKGPGSYTGLRIGVSLAKGLAYSLNKPLLAVSTLQIMCLHPEVKRQINLYKDLVLCPMLDARRMEVYTAVYDIGLKAMMDVQPMILDELSFHDLLSQGGVLFFGSGSLKFKDAIKNDSAHFVGNVWPQASEMAMLSQIKYDQNEFEDLAYFEPFYLKEFQGTTPKKML